VSEDEPETSQRGGDNQRSVWPRNGEHAEPGKRRSRRPVAGCRERDGEECECQRQDHANQAGRRRQPSDSIRLNLHTHIES
jgi:hypothetical protein